MKELVEYLARALAAQPEEVSVAQSAPDSGPPALELTVAEADRNQIIGKQGRTVKAMRTLLAAAAAKSGGPRIMLKITGEAAPAPPAPAAEEDPPADGR